MDRHLQHRRAQAELVGRQSGERGADRRADGERAPRHQRLAVEAEQQRRQAADADAAQAGEGDDVADAEARHRFAERRQQEAHRPQASRIGGERGARGRTIARLQAAMEEHAGGDDGDDVPGEPRAGRRLAQEQRAEHFAAPVLQDDDEGGEQRRRQAGKACDQGARTARRQQAEHEQQRQQGEQGRHVTKRCGRATSRARCASRLAGRARPAAVVGHGDRRFGQRRIGEAAAGGAVRRLQFPQGQMPLRTGSPSISTLQAPQQQLAFRVMMQLPKRGRMAACAVRAFRLEPAPCPDSSAGRARHS